MVSGVKWVLKDSVCVRGKNPQQLSRALPWLLELLRGRGCRGDQGWKGKAWGPG